MLWKNDVGIRTTLPDSDYVTQAITRQIVLVMMLLCYHLWFQIDFACPCTTDLNYIHCYSYMVLPCLLIASIIVWNDKRIARKFRYSCYHSSVRQRRCHVKFCCELFLNVLQAALSGFLWCGFVLVDGDWYLCCGSPQTEEMIPLCCKNESEVGTPEWERKVNKKNQSMIIGLICILLTSTCTLLLVLPYSRWCMRRNYFQALLEEAILEKTENILMTEMGKAAADSVTKSLLVLSSASTAPAKIKNVQKKAENQSKEETLLNVNADWKKVAYIAGGVIDSIPNNVANNKNNAHLHGH